MAKAHKEEEIEEVEEVNGEFSDDDIPDDVPMVLVMIEAGEAEIWEIGRVASLEVDLDRIAVLGEEAVPASVDQWFDSFPTLEDKIDAALKIAEKFQEDLEEDLKEEPEEKFGEEFFCNQCQKLKPIEKGYVEHGIYTVCQECEDEANDLLSYGVVGI